MVAGLLWIRPRKGGGFKRLKFQLWNERNNVVIRTTEGA